MVFLGFKVEKNKEIFDFIDKVRFKFKNTSDISKNAFSNLKIVSKPFGDELVVLLRFDIIYPNFSPHLFVFSFVFLFASFVLGYSWLYTIGRVCFLIASVVALFFSKYPLLLYWRFNLHRIGCKSFKSLKNSFLIDFFVFKKKKGELIE